METYPDDAAAPDAHGARGWGTAGQVTLQRRGTPSEAIVARAPELNDTAMASVEDEHLSPLCSSVLQDLLRFKRFRALRSQHAASDSPLRMCISAPAHPSETLCRTMSLPLCRGSPTSEDACTTSLPMSNHLQGHCMPATLHSLMASPSAGSSDSYPGPDRNKPFQDDDGIVHIVAPEAPDEACDHAAGEGRFMPKADLFSTAHSDSREVSFAQLLNELASKSAGANEVACRSHSFDAGDRAPPISDHAHRTSYDFVHSGFTTNSDSTAPYRAGATELASLGSIGPPRSRRGATTKSASMHNESRPGRPKPAKQPRALAVPLSVAPPSPLAAKDSLQACASTLHRCSSMASLRPDAASRHRNPSMRLLRVLSSNDYETQLKWSN